MDYCMWTTNCTALGDRKKASLLESHICCFTCKKKASCSYACKDRDSKTSCKYQCSAQYVEERWTPRKYVPAAGTASTKKQQSPEELLKAQQAEQQALKDRLSSKVAAKTAAKQVKSKSATATKPSKVPSSVKELAAVTGATYARANYYINTKKLSYEEALKVLKK